jgi:hypothetical protein
VIPQVASGWSKSVRYPQHETRPPGSCSWQQPDIVLDWVQDLPKQCQAVAGKRNGWRLDPTPYAYLPLPPLVEKRVKQSCAMGCVVTFNLVSMCLLVCLQWKVGQQKRTFRSHPGDKSSMPPKK